MLAMLGLCQPCSEDAGWPRGKNNLLTYNPDIKACSSIMHQVAVFQIYSNALLKLNLN